MEQKTPGDPGPGRGAGGASVPLVIRDPSVLPGARVGPGDGPREDPRPCALAPRWCVNHSSAVPASCPVWSAPRSCRDAPELRAPLGRSVLPLYRPPYPLIPAPASGETGRVHGGPRPRAPTRCPGPPLTQPVPHAAPRAAALPPRVTTGPLGVLGPCFPTRGAPAACVSRPAVPVPPPAQMGSHRPRAGAPRSFRQTHSTRSGVSVEWPPRRSESCPPPRRRRPPVTGYRARRLRGRTANRRRAPSPALGFGEGLSRTARHPRGTHGPKRHPGRGGPQRAVLPQRSPSP